VYCSVYVVYNICYNVHIAAAMAKLCLYMYICLFNSFYTVGRTIGKALRSPTSAVPPTIYFWELA